MSQNNCEKYKTFDDEELEQYQTRPLSGEQINAGKQIIDCYINDPNGIRWTVLLAQMQSGKTDTFLLVCCELIRLKKVESAVIFSGNSETDLKDQLIKKVQGQDSEFYDKYYRYLEENIGILSSRQIQPIINKIKQNISVIWGTELNKTNKISYSKTLFVWEEAHYAQTVNQCPDKFLNKIGISANGDKIVLQEKDNYVLSVSATPFSEYSDIYHFGQCKKIVYMQPGAGYNSVKNILESGRLKSFSNIETGLVTALSTPYDSPKYALVRISNKNENIVSKIISQFPSWKQVIYDSLGDSKTRAIGIKTWEGMETAPEQNTVILLRGKCRMGKNLEKKHISFVMETVKSSNTDTILQGLLGRVCGYAEGSDKIDVYLHNKIIKSSEIERYIDLVNGQSIIPSKATNIAKTTIFKTKYPIIPFKVLNVVSDANSSEKTLRNQIIKNIYNQISEPEFDFERTDEKQFEEIKRKIQIYFRTNFITKMNKNRNDNNENNNENNNDDDLSSNIELIVHNVSTKTKQKWIDFSDTICKYENTNEICPKNLWHTGIAAKGQEEGRIINVFYYSESYGNTIAAGSAYIYGVTETPNPHCVTMSSVIKTTGREVFSNNPKKSIKNDNIDVVDVDELTKMLKPSKTLKPILFKKNIDLNLKDFKMNDFNITDFKVDNVKVDNVKVDNVKVDNVKVDNVKKNKKRSKKMIEIVCENEDYIEIIEDAHYIKSAPICNIYIENFNIENLNIENLNIINIENININNFVSNKDEELTNNNDNNNNDNEPIFLD